MITQWCEQNRATHRHPLEHGGGQNSLTFSFTDTFPLGKITKVSVENFQGGQESGKSPPPHLLPPALPALLTALCHQSLATEHQHDTINPYHNHPNGSPDYTHLSNYRTTCGHRNTHSTRHLNRERLRFRKPKMWQTKVDHNLCHHRTGGPLQHSCKRRENWH